MLARSAKFGPADSGALALLLVATQLAFHRLYRGTRRAEIFLDHNSLIERGLSQRIQLLDRLVAAGQLSADFLFAQLELAALLIHPLQRFIE